MKFVSLKNCLYYITVTFSSILIVKLVQFHSNKFNLKSKTNHDNQRTVFISHSFTTRYLPPKPFRTTGIFLHSLSANEQYTENFALKKEIRVIISSLGRSGSSMLGEIISTFNTNPFYVFEPLHTVQKGSNLSFTIAKQIMQDIFDCNLTTDVTVQYLQNWPHSHRTFLQKPSGRRSFQYYRQTLSWDRRKVIYYPGIVKFCYT